MATNKPTGDNARKGAVKKRKDFAGRADDLYEAFEGIRTLAKKKFKGVRMEK